ncbi:MAG: hypothetical protein ACT4OK_12745 [Gemmobacter sp.]
MKWLLHKLGRPRAPVAGDGTAAEAAALAVPPVARKPLVHPSERPIPFVPRGDRTPLFFLHIPKTSGSSVNRLLADVYGSGNLIEHAEYTVPKLLDGSLPTMAVDCVSAHFPLCHWALYRETDAYARATILRDPWQRLVSHVNWTNRFNNGEPLPTSGRGAAATRAVVEVLARTDFQRRDHIQALFDVVQAEPDFILFDNLQVRMLVTGNPQSSLQVPDEGSLRNARSNLKQFAVWGICEDQAGFQQRLLNAVGSDVQPVPIHENAGQPLALTPDNDIAREVFAPWIGLDQSLYDRAVAMLRVRARKAQTT